MEHNYRIASNVFFFCPSLFLSFYKRCNKQTAPRDGCRPRKWDIIINRRGATCGPDWRKCAQVSTVGWGESVYVYTIYPEETYFWYFHDDITAPFCLLFPCFLSLFLFLTSKKKTQRKCFYKYRALCCCCARRELFSVTRERELYTCVLVTDW